MRATYSPEDNKLRLYFEGERIPRDEWDALRAKGYTWTMKQTSDMVATWTPAREDAALELAGIIDDEDQPRAERSADRADRFMGYQEKREDEATGHADRYDAGPTIHANQSEARAERAAKRHDAQAARAVCQWSKAEYWQARTAGVIAHAKYVERADVRHRRIKGLEADERRVLADYVPSETIEGVEIVRRYRGQEYVDKGHDMIGWFGQGRGKYCRSGIKANGWQSPEGSRWLAHFRLRLAYERQMLEAQGGTMADAVEIEVGGFIKSGTKEYRIEKLTKDKAGRVNKVYFYGPTSNSYDRQGNAYGSSNPAPLVLHPFSAENIKPESYRMPTQAEREAFKAEKASEEKGPPLINPDADACAAILAHLNATQEACHKRHSSAPYEPAEVHEMTADEWKVHSARSGSWRVREVLGARIRTNLSWRGVSLVIVLTDKPRKSLPVAKEEPSRVAAG